MLAITEVYIRYMKSAYSELQTFLVVCLFESNVGIEIQSVFDT